MHLPILIFCLIGYAFASPARHIFQPFLDRITCESQPYILGKPSPENPHSILPGTSKTNLTWPGYSVFCQSPPAPVPGSTFADCALLTKLLPTAGIVEKFTPNNPDPNYRLPFIRRHNRCIVVVEFNHDAPVLAQNMRLAVDHVCPPGGAKGSVCWRSMRWGLREIGISRWGFGRLMEGSGRRRRG